jgi:hypothetical protein
MDRRAMFGAEKGVVIIFLGPRGGGRRWTRRNLKTQEAFLPPFCFLIYDLNLKLIFS